ncbi:hypothetical protein [Verminephrobacter aporrectodeae]|uniref:hypothetical protein n=1 Tax=Verminephrobacter aporrectodeae TaxID=1110389 RepID=UPI0022438B7C|nr:hypothetical protein [Verminephrobacter aporrectodeae]MCW8177664.1 hypothetical protein [Verminephrobacter aporrectodeae subsp. tuberculatae]MCW8204902.1 hypothetical protein [Verminephrobacter aporrectodeae subsp. tuberculatae]
MYSYDDRIRAVALFIKLSKRVRPTIRQLGYPTKNSLKDWYREYEQRLDLPMGLLGISASVTAHFGIVTADFGTVTAHFGDVTEGRLITV